MTKKRNDNQSDEIAEANLPRTFKAAREIGKAKGRLEEVEALFREARKQLMETQNRYDWAHYDDYADDENALSRTEFREAKRQFMEAREHYDDIHRRSLKAELDLMRVKTRHLRLKKEAEQVRRKPKKGAARVASS